MKLTSARHSLLGMALCLSMLHAAGAQSQHWRAATRPELTSVLPSRASVEGEHIETEMRTASGIVNAEGQYIAGAVLITAGYSADGKYSHYLIVQAQIEVGGVLLIPGNYALGWSRMDAQDALNVHLNDATSGKLMGVAVAHRIPGSGGVESLRIWPPEEKGFIQIGRFEIPYKFPSK